MTAQKRRLEDTAATPKSKKTRLAQDGAKDKKSKKRDAGGAEQTSVPLPWKSSTFLVEVVLVSRLSKSKLSERKR